MEGQVRGAEASPIKSDPSLPQRTTALLIHRGEPSAPGAVREAV